ncbi:MAG TPA: F0F1 ATP synthase subunit delta [Burkholderiales bacterium]|jgi:F-type H+-transporting ATPase subunit delta
MPEPITVARPYAEAVFDLAAQAGALAQWSQELEAMARVAQQPDMLRLIADPKVSDEQRARIFLELCGEGVTPEARNFVALLLANNRLALLPEIRELFEQHKNEREGVVEAQISSAFALDDAQLRSLVADLERRFSRRVDAHVTVDRELIGGVKIVVGDTVIDGSVRGKLAGMSAALLKV